ncbi:monovalent cation:proton antiporter-2 (CPA2) family protein [Luteibacter yeojuensis]
MTTGMPDSQLVHAVSLLAAAVIVVPLFRRLGLGSVMGYLAAGLIVGPYGLGWFTDPDAILHLAELGVVMFLFLIGLEMRPSHLMSLGRTMLRVGILQIVACAAALTGVAMTMGLPARAAFIGAMGFVLTSTAIVTQLLSERGELERPLGQEVVSVLLMEDLLVVPLLALVAWMAPAHAASAPLDQWLSVLKGIAALAVLVAAGRWLLDPFFRILAGSRVREVLCAGALLVVLGAALLMEVGGLSMAMGAFVAGVLLSGSSFRHQIEADIEPFRGVLLGLFFLGVGMALDLAAVRAHWQPIVAGVLAMMAVKGLCVYLVARATRSSPQEALERAALMALGGEFAFVLYANAASAGLIDARANAILVAIVVLSMALAPLFTLFVRRWKREPERRVDDAQMPNGLAGSVLMVGFGRFGQVVSQSLLARDVDVTVIDTDIEMIEAAAEFGFRIYYGDGTRLDVLQAAGAGRARIIVVCVDRRETANTIVDLTQAEFPKATLLVRTYDREHSLRMSSLGIRHHVRETFESAMLAGSDALRLLGIPDTEIAHVAAIVRERDAERFASESAGVDWAKAGHKSFSRRPRPVPLTQPHREAEMLNPPLVGTSPDHPHEGV